MGMGIQSLVLNGPIYNMVQSMMAIIIEAKN